MRPASARACVLRLIVLSSVFVAAAPPPPPTATAASARAATAPAWEPLAPGLELGTFAGPYASVHGDSKVRVLRIDPTRWSLRLLNASRAGEGEWHTVRAWVTRAGAVAGIN